MIYLFVLIAFRPTLGPTTRSALAPVAPAAPHLLPTYMPLTQVVAAFCLALFGGVVVLGNCFWHLICTSFLTKHKVFHISHVSATQDEKRAWVWMWQDSYQAWGRGIRGAHPCCCSSWLQRRIKLMNKKRGIQHYHYFCLPFSTNIFQQQSSVPDRILNRTLRFPKSLINKFGTKSTLKQNQIMCSLVFIQFIKFAHFCIQHEKPTKWKGKDIFHSTH